MKKNPKILYNASEAAKYLGISRQHFYFLKRKYKIEAAEKEYHMPLYALLDLTKVKKWRDQWKGINGEQ